MSGGTISEQSPKFQASSLKETPSFKLKVQIRRLRSVTGGIAAFSRKFLAWWILGFEAWSFFGAWSLKLGISCTEPRPPSPARSSADLRSSQQHRPASPNLLAHLKPHEEIGRAH